MNNYKMDKKYENIQRYIVKLRRDLHQIPELGTDLPKTRAYIIKELDRLKIPYLCSKKDSGIMAAIEGEKRGRTVALRTDMDALPLEEETGLPVSLAKCRGDARLRA